MKETQVQWSSQPVVHGEAGVAGTAHLAVKALGVVFKHFLIPLSETDVMGWRNNDHYRHHLFELEDKKGDQVWIKPWLIGELVDGQECVIRFEPGEFADDVFKESLLERLTHLFSSSKHNALFGIYLVVMREEEGWRAVFGFRMDGGAAAELLHDLPVREAVCLVLDGDMERVERWLDGAYK